MYLRCLILAYCFYPLVFASGGVLFASPAQNQIFEEKTIEDFEGLKDASLAQKWKSSFVLSSLSFLLEKGVPEQSEQCLQLHADHIGPRLSLDAAKAFFLKGYVQSLVLWLKNHGAPVILFADLRDQNHKRRLLKWGQSRGRQWSRLKLYISPALQQRPPQPSSQAGLWFYGIVIRLAHKKAHKEKIRLYIDNIKLRKRPFQKLLKPAWSFAEFSAKFQSRRRLESQKKGLPSILFIGKKFDI